MFRRPVPGPSPMALGPRRSVEEIHERDCGLDELCGAADVSCWWIYRERASHLTGEAMNSSNRGKNALPKWLVLFVLLTVTAVASPPKPSAPKASAPKAASRPASAPHAAPAQHPGGGPSGAQRPGGANNRGPGVSGSNRGPGVSGNNRGPGSANANKGGPANAGKGGPANAGKGGPANAGKGGPANAGRGGPANAGRGGPANAGKGGPANAGRGGPANAGRHQPAGSKTVAMKNGGSATFRKNGQLRSIQTHGMTINHGMHGGRRVEGMHNGRRVVSYGRHGGYSQRAYYRHGGREYSQRTYYRGGHYYAYGYRNYGWACNPWPAPVYYGWGWGGAPWYGYYGPYFAPYPVYPTAGFWLTDYLIAAHLQAAYAAQQEAGDNNGELIPPAIQNATADEIAALWSTDPLVAANLQATYGAYMLGGGAPAAAKGGATGLSPEVKQAIADEMKNEIAAEKDAAANGLKDTPSGDQLPPALNPKIRIFVVANDEDLTTSDGVECALTPGDVVYRTGDKPDDDNMVDATVKSSKKDECAVGATVG